MTVRAVAPDDRAAWEPLWEAYNSFYRHTAPAEVTDATFARLCAAGDTFALREADSGGAVQVYWHTQEYNGAARFLYDQVARRTSFVKYER